MSTRSSSRKRSTSQSRARSSSQSRQRRGSKSASGRRGRLISPSLQRQVQGMKNVRCVPRQAGQENLYHLVDANTLKALGPVYRASTPTGAARKAVTDGYTRPVLLSHNTCRVYAFKGRLERVRDPEVIESSGPRNGMTFLHRPKVESLGFANLPTAASATSSGTKRAATSGATRSTKRSRRQ